MIVIYTVAHSDPRGSPGCHSLTGVNENDVALAAMQPFRNVIEANGYEFGSLHGPIEPVVRLTNKALRAAGPGHVAIELHFNATPLVPCPNPECGAKIHAGTTCPVCGALPARRWRFGPTAMYDRRSQESRRLAKTIIEWLRVAMPWAARRDPIPMPDARYGRKTWPENILPPACLVEAGFGCDPRFSDLISTTAGQERLGATVAEGVIDFIERTK